MRRVSRCRFSLFVSASLGLLLPFAGGASAGLARPSETCTSPNCPITINDNGSPTQDQAATPYPSEMGVGGVDFTAFIDKVTVTIQGLTHPSLEDVDILLAYQVGSEVDVVELMSDVGGRIVGVSNLNLTFDDAASSSLPQGAPPLSGTYKPTNYPGTAAAPCVGDSPPTSPTRDPFPPPAPSPPPRGYAQELSAFHGRPVQGTFRLYVGDDCNGASGQIESWSLDFTFIPCSDVCVAKHADAVTVSKGSPIGFTVYASNGRYIPDGWMDFFLDDPLPSGAEVDWSINPPYSGPDSCSITGPIGSERLSCGGTFYAFFDSMSVHVSSPSAGCGTYSNTATVDGFASDGQPAGPSEDTASTTVADCPTGLALRSFVALESNRGVRLRWRTASETQTLGFNLYREQRGKLVKLNGALIPSVFGGTTNGQAYSWLDRRAPRASAKLAYKLQAVNLDATRSWIGTATIAH